MNLKLESTLKKIAKNENLQNCTFEIANNSSKGDGFTGSVTVLKIIGKNDKNEIQTINCIAKRAFANDAVRKELPLNVLYRNEDHMYRTVFPTLELFQNEKIQTSFTFAPKYYGSILDDKEETIILENLIVLGYKLHPLEFSMNGSHVTLILENYARFHASSFALRDQQIEKFNEITNGMPEFFTEFVFKIQLKSANGLYRKAALSLDPSSDFEALQKFNYFLDNTDLLYEEYKNTSTEKYCAILHGDAWSNNMMFNYEDLNNLERPTSARFLDFQIARLSFPVVDLANFIYMSATKEVLDSLEYYLQYYHEKFSEHLEKLGSDPQELYPFSVFKEQWRKFAKLFLLYIPLLMRVTEGARDERPDMEVLAEQSGELFDNMFSADIRNEEFFNDKMRHSILHFYNNNFL